MNVVLVDGEAPWVQTLFAAMPPDVTVHAFRPRGPAALIRQPVEPLHGWRQTGPRWWERVLPVPSWSKAPRLTSSICAFLLGRRLMSLRNDAVVVYTLPYYGPLAARFASVPQVYFAYDPYRCYTGWDAAAIAAGEREMLDGCDAAFAISPALADDFRKLSNRPIFVQPNGVSEAFLAAFDEPLPPPADLPLGGPPIVGCVGQISRAYDWDLLAKLVRLNPGHLFVFVGPMFGEAPRVLAQIEAVFAAENVRWLGPKPHGELPRYINRFTVCLNPLRVEPCNNRRSLLRLYDYLASDRPIASTGVAAALEHRPHVEIGQDAAGLATLIGRMSEEGYAVDRAARRQYVRLHTWGRRAETFLTNLRSVIANRPA